jgi:hypothetical protein
MSSMKLRSNLFVLVVAALAPMLVFAIVAAQLLLRHERQTMEREAIGRARAAMCAVDAHVRASIAALETLAGSKTLEAGDIRAFHAESQRVLRTQPAWVNIGLISASKLQLSDAVYAFGRASELARDDASLTAALRGQVAIGDVVSGTAVRSPTARIRVPVAYGGEVRYVLSAPLNLKTLAEILHAQQVPEDWAITLVDRDRHVIVRSPAVPAATPESDSLREAVERQPEGWFHGRTLERRDTYTAYVTSPLTGWVLGIAIPDATVEADARHAFVIMSLGVLVALAIGALLSWLIDRRASR